MTVKPHNQGDVALIVKHARGQAVFGPFFYRHKDRNKNVYDVKRDFESAGYEVEQVILYQMATFPSFSEACPPPTKESEN